jgi:hypothetical protein
METRHSDIDFFLVRVLEKEEGSWGVRGPLGTGVSICGASGALRVALKVVCLLPSSQDSAAVGLL